MIKVIILAGGIGKRMKPVQTDKCLLKFLGKELIVWQVEKLKSIGLNDVLVVCSPNNAEQIKKLFGDKVQYVVQTEAKGMADALLSIDNVPEEALIVGAHDIFDESAYKAVLDKQGDGVILGYKVSKYFPGGYLVVEGEKLKGIIEKPGEGKEPGDLVNIVVHLHRKFPKLIEYLKNIQSDKDDVYEKALDAMMKDGCDFRVASYEGKWVAIKYPWNVLDAQGYFLSKCKRKIPKDAQVSAKATINGDTVIESGAKIMAGAVVSNSYIGKDCVVGTNSLVRDSHLCEGVTVGFGSEVARSYLGENTFLHMTYLGDSIVGQNCNFGAGTITANWRFDARAVKFTVAGERISTGKQKLGIICGDNVKTGINVSLMPGVAIASGSKIMPGEIVKRDMNG